MGCCFVPVASPGGDEGGEVPVVIVQGNAVVAIPAVKHSLFLATWDRACLVERTLRVVGFQVTGSPTGTGSMTPSATSWSRPALTLSCQWRGTRTGV